MGVYEGTQEVLALADSCRDVAIRDAHCFDPGLGSRAVHLYVILADIISR